SGSKPALAAVTQPVFSFGDAKASFPPAEILKLDRTVNASGDQTNFGIVRFFANSAPVVGQTDGDYDTTLSYQIAAGTLGDVPRGRAGGHAGKDASGTLILSGPNTVASNNFLVLGAGGDFSESNMNGFEIRGRSRAFGTVV